MMLTSGRSDDGFSSLTGIIRATIRWSVLKWTPLLSGVHVDSVLLQQGDDAGLLLWVVRVQRHPDLAVLAETVVQGGLLLWDPRLVGKAGRRGGSLYSGDLAEGIRVVLAPFLVREGAPVALESWRNSGSTSVDSVQVPSWWRTAPFPTRKSPG